MEVPYLSAAVRAGGTPGAEGSLGTKNPGSGYSFLWRCDFQWSKAFDPTPRYAEPAVCTGTLKWTVPVLCQPIVTKDGLWDAYGASGLIGSHGGLFGCIEIGNFNIAVRGTLHGNIRVELMEVGILGSQVDIGIDSKGQRPPGCFHPLPSAWVRVHPHRFSDNKHSRFRHYRYPRGLRSVPPLHR